MFLYLVLALRLFFHCGLSGWSLGQCPVVVEVSHLFDSGRLPEFEWCCNWYCCQMYSDAFYTIPFFCLILAPVIHHVSILVDLLLWILGDKPNANPVLAWATCQTDMSHWSYLSLVSLGMQSMPRQYPKWPSIAAVGGQKLAEDSPVTWFELWNLCVWCSWSSVSLWMADVGSYFLPGVHIVLVSHAAQICRSSGQVSHWDVSNSASPFALGITAWDASGQVTFFEESTKNLYIHIYSTYNLILVTMTSGFSSYNRWCVYIYIYFGKSNSTPILGTFPSAFFPTWETVFGTNSGNSQIAATILAPPGVAIAQMRWTFAWASLWMTRCWQKAADLSYSLILIFQGPANWVSYYASYFWKSRWRLVTTNSTQFNTYPGRLCAHGVPCFAGLSGLQWLVGSGGPTSCISPAFLEGKDIAGVDAASDGSWPINVCPMMLPLLSHVASRYAPRPGMPTPIRVTRVSHLLQRRMPSAKPPRDSMCWHVWYGALPVSQSWSKWQSCLVRILLLIFGPFWAP